MNKISINALIFEATLNELNNFIDVNNEQQLGNFLNILIVTVINNEMVPEVIQLTNNARKKYVNNRKL